MGVYINYDTFTQKWVVTGFNIHKEFSSKEEAEAAWPELWEKHNRNLEVFAMISYGLLGLRR